MNTPVEDLLLIETQFKEFGVILENIRLAINIKGVHVPQDWSPFLYPALIQRIAVIHREGTLDVSDSVSIVKG